MINYVKLQLLKMLFQAGIKYVDKGCYIFWQLNNYGQS